MYTYLIVFVLFCVCAGFSKVIPGYPRYSVIGDSTSGIYNLRISNASLEDDAEYQCQVGPARFNKAIRANARLTVIGKHTYCTSIYILYIYLSTL